jgi:hypothetical protein
MLVIVSRSPVMVPVHPEFSERTRLLNWHNVTIGSRSVLGAVQANSAGEAALSAPQLTVRLKNGHTMNRFPAFDLAGSLRLTLQDRLKGEIATLRGKRASAPPLPRINRYAKSADPGVTELLGATPFLKGSFQPVQDEPLQPRPDGARFEERSYSNAAGTKPVRLERLSRPGNPALWLCCMVASSRPMISRLEPE